MPNHCGNKLIITGDKSERDRFINEMVVGNKLELQNILYTPYNYDGPIKLWGTKWGTYDLEIPTHDDACTICMFQTAWCPYNEDVQTRMARKYYNLSFKLLFAERGASFCGFYRIYSASGSALVSHMEDCRFDKCPGCDNCDDDDDDSCTSVLCKEQQEYQDIYDISG